MHSERILKKYLFLKIYEMGMEKFESGFVLLFQGQTKERAFLGNIAQQLKNNAGVILSEAVSVWINK